MLKVYVTTKENRIETEFGDLITANPKTVKAANEGKVTDALKKSMRIAGLYPAMGEEISIIRKDKESRETLADLNSWDGPNSQKAE